jgi:hypothetical protein
MDTPASNMDTRLAETAMRWSGWGSPVGLGVFLLCLSGCVLLLRFAWVLH